MSKNIQQQKIAQVLQSGARSLRKLASERKALYDENQQLKQKLAAQEVLSECEKLAAEMHSKGLRQDYEFSELVEDLVKSASEGKLQIIQEAVKMAAPNMDHNFHINEDENVGVGMTDFESYLVGDVG